MTVPDFRTVSVEELARRIRARELTAAAVTDAALERIAAADPVLNAFVAVDAEGARAQAAAVDARLDAGETVGPLAGVPLGVKDLEDAAGFVTTRGAAMHRHDPPAPADSTEVARLRAAGCVVIGKTNTPEYGWTADTHNPVFGATLNPWDTSRSPGGSSGGSSAAVAAGLVPLATGSDGGGSIRIPSALTGLSGLKPSQGRVPGGPAPMGTLDLSCVGPMARRIRDVALALDVVVGPHPGDLRSMPAPPAPWRPALDDPEPPRRVLWAPSLDGLAVDAEVAAVTAAAVERLADAGVDVVETGAVIEHPIGPFALLFFGMMVPSHRPLYGTPAWAEVTPGLAAILEGAFERVTVASQAEARVAAQALSVRVHEALAGFDALLTPTVAGQTPRSGAPGTIDGVETEQWVRFTYPFNLTRQPAASVCAGFCGDGMPVGLQIVGPQTADRRVLEVAAFVEDTLALDPVAPLPG